MCVRISERKIITRDTRIRSIVLYSENGGYSVPLARVKLQKRVLCVRVSAVRPVRACVRVAAASLLATHECRWHARLVRWLRDRLRMGGEMVICALSGHSHRTVDIVEAVARVIECSAGFRLEKRVLNLWLRSVTRSESVLCVPVPRTVACLFLGGSRFVL